VFLFLLYPAQPSPHHHHHHHYYYHYYYYHKVQEVGIAGRRHPILVWGI